MHAGAVPLETQKCRWISKSCVNTLTLCVVPVDANRTNVDQEEHGLGLQRSLKLSLKVEPTGRVAVELSLMHGDEGSMQNRPNGSIHKDACRSDPMDELSQAVDKRNRSSCANELQTLMEAAESDREFEDDDVIRVLRGKINYLCEKLKLNCARPTFDNQNRLLGRK